MLSEDERKKYISRRDSFLKLEKNIICEIRAKQENLAVLVKKLENHRPKTPNGQFMCPDCKTISMAYNALKSGIGDAQFDVEEEPVLTEIEVYECEICGKTEKNYPEMNFFT